MLSAQKIRPPVRVDTVLGGRVLIPKPTIAHLIRVYQVKRVSATFVPINDRRPNSCLGFPEKFAFSPDPTKAFCNGDRGNKYRRIYSHSG